MKLYIPYLNGVLLILVTGISGHKCRAASGAKKTVHIWAQDMSAGTGWGRRKASGELRVQTRSRAGIEPGFICFLDSISSCILHDFVLTW